MISAPDRRETLQLIEEAVAAGARRAQACAELGLSLRSLQRWMIDCFGDIFRCFRNIYRHEAWMK